VSFARYPAYKDSGVAWLGDVPAHWGIDRLKRVSSIAPSNVDKKTYEDQVPVRLCNYTDVYYNDSIVAGMELMEATATPEQVQRFSLRAGDTIITKDSETADDIASSAFVPADLPGVVCGYHLAVVRPLPQTEGRFIKRLFDSSFVKACVEVRANGLTRVGLSQYALDNLEVPRPPVEEQRAIAAFLDRETAKIDALVAEQRRLMDLLREQRQAVISHAVTKGLTPDAPMKDSGVEWLGEVPAHWSLDRLQLHCRFISGRAHEPFVDADGEHICVTSRFVSTEGAAQRLCSVNLEPAVHGDSLVVMSDLPNGRALAKAFFVQDERSYAINQRVCALRPTKAHPRYLYFLIDRSPELLQHDDGMNQTHLSNSDFLKPRFPFPPIEEQVAIARYLDQHVVGMSQLIADADDLITLLMERRAALITAAVTGQIDVRGLALAEAA
jgi:type I restriction enzyme S subunit